MGDYDPRMDPDYNWDDPEITEEKLEALKMERQVMSMDFKQQTMNIIQEAGPQAALRIVALSRSSHNDNVALSASKYLIDLIRDPEGEASGILEDLVSGLVKDAEKIANGHIV